MSLKAGQVAPMHSRAVVVLGVAIPDEKPSSLLQRINTASAKMLHSTTWAYFTAPHSTVSAQRIMNSSTLAAAASCLSSQSKFVCAQWAIIPKKHSCWKCDYTKKHTASVCEASTLSSGTALLCEETSSPVLQDLGQCCQQQTSSRWQRPTGRKAR